MNKEAACSFNTLTVFLPASNDHVPFPLHAYPALYFVPACNMKMHMPHTYLDRISTSLSRPQTYAFPRQADTQHDNEMIECQLHPRYKSRQCRDGTHRIGSQPESYIIPISGGIRPNIANAASNSSVILPLRFLERTSIQVTIISETF